MYLYSTDTVHTNMFALTLTRMHKLPRDTAEVRKWWRRRKTARNRRSVCDIPFIHIHMHILTTVATINVCVCVCMWTVFYFQFANNTAPKSMATFNLCDIRNEQCTLTICQNQPISHCAWHHQHKYSHFVDNFTQHLPIPRSGHFALSFWCLFVQLIITFSYIEIGLDSALVCVCVGMCTCAMYIVCAMLASSYVCNS